MEKVYVVTCGIYHRGFQEPDPETWVESVHRTEKAAQEYVRERYLEKLEGQLKLLRESEGCYEPELPYFWRVRDYMVKD